MLVPHRVATYSCHVLCKCSLDHRRGSRARRHITRDEWKTPGGCAVPQVFDCWIVVESYAPHPLLACQFPDPRIADIGVIHAEVVALGVVSQLQKAANVLRPGASQEE